MTETVEDLRYSVSVRGLAQVGDIEDLIDRGLVERDGNDYTVVIPPRRDRRIRNGNGTGSYVNKWTDEELIDRIRLWTLIVGKQPAGYQWRPDRLAEVIRSNIENLRARVAVHQEVQKLFEAGDWPTRGVIERRFGSVNGAAVIAGFEPRSPGKQPADIRPRSKPKTVAECIDELEAARDGNKEGQRTALYALAVAALAEANKLTNQSEKLDGPAFVEWLEEHGGLKQREQFGASTSRAIRRWESGEGVSIARADELLVALGHHIHDLPDEVWQ